MKPGAETTLKRVRPGDVVTLKGGSFRVLSAEREAGFVTLELEDRPDQPAMTLIGVEAMPIAVTTGPPA